MKPQALQSQLPVLTGDANRDIASLRQSLSQILRLLDSYEPLVSGKGDVLVGKEQMSAGAMHGFIYMPRVQGVPVGTPTDYGAGSPYAFDEVHDVFYIYDFARSAWVAFGQEDSEDAMWLRILMELEEIDAKL